jgi:curved DNA-binding protein CbpA
MVDYYAVLGVNPTAEDVVIRAAYKALAQRYHPDRFAGSKEEAHRRMTALTQAYEVLADPVRRPKYDRRRTLYTRAVAARVNRARRFASTALNPRSYRSIREVRGKYRAALAALMGTVVVLSAFNLYTHSGRIKTWLGFDTTSASTAAPSPVDASALEAAIQMGPPMPPSEIKASVVKPKKRSSTRSAASSRPAKRAPAATTAQPCDEGAAALGLCIRDKPAGK